MHRVAIYGAGHLTKALLKGLSKVTSQPISIFNRTRANLGTVAEIYPQLRPVDDAEELIAQNSLVFFIIPPAAIATLQRSLIEKLRATGAVLVSFTNGLSVAQLSQRWPGVKIIKAQPNINWQIGAGVTLYNCNALVDASELSYFEALLAPISELFRVRGEEDFDRLGTLTATMPGLVAALLHHVEQAYNLAGAVEKRLFNRALLGTVRYIAESGKEYQEIVCEVANKGGLTEVGVTALNGGLPGLLSDLRARMDLKVAQRKESLAQLN